MQPKILGKTAMTIVVKQTNSMKKSLSWEANRSIASQEIPCIVWNPKVHSQATATCPYPEPQQSSPCLLISFL